MPSTTTPSETITATVTSWPGVTAGTGSRGEFGFRVGRREIGHLHGDHAAHFGFPKAVWHRLHDAGRIDFHPVFPGKPGFGARRIEGADDVEDVIRLLRLNYDRVVDRHGLPARLDTPIPGLHATQPEPLPFAPEMDIRAFVLERPRGNLLVYASPAIDADRGAIEALGPVRDHYLSHGHEEMFLADWPGEHLDPPWPERFALGDDFEVIPIPGHTPDATAFLWDTGQHRLLFTGDSLYADRGEWKAAVLGSSDPPTYRRSLELIRELEFDVLVPWAVTRGEPSVEVTSQAETRRRIDALLASRDWSA